MVVVGFGDVVGWVGDGGGWGGDGVVGSLVDGGGWGLFGMVVGWFGDGVVVVGWVVVVRVVMVVCRW